MTAPKLSLPVWALVKTTREESPPEHQPCESDDVAMVFSTTERAIDFLKLRVSGEWKVRLISYKDDVTRLVAELQDEKIGLCLDPEPDGSGGTLYTLEEFADAATQL
jgi:hypothetical protein